MAWKRKVSGGILAVVGYLLSPLSWWNDLFVNVPLALLFAWIVSAFYRPAFSIAMVIGYWLTNVLGLVLMHKGARQLLSKQDSSQQSKNSARRELVLDVVVSLAYTLLIVALLKFGVLKPFQYYFSRP